MWLRYTQNTQWLTALRVPPLLEHPHAGEHRGGVGQGRGDARGVVPHRPAHILYKENIDF